MYRKFNFTSHRSRPTKYNVSEIEIFTYLLESTQSLYCQPVLTYLSTPDIKYAEKSKFYV